MLELAGSTTVYLACGVTDLRKSYHGLAAIIKLKFQLDPYVCVLQPQADLNQDSSMGRIRFLDSDEKAGQKLFSLAGHTG